jgi:hypothetical protein
MNVWNSHRVDRMANTQDFLYDAEVIQRLYFDTEFMSNLFWCSGFDVVCKFAHNHK